MTFSFNALTIFRSLHAKYIFSATTLTKVTQQNSLQIGKWNSQMLTINFRQVILASYNITKSILLWQFLSFQHAIVCKEFVWVALVDVVALSLTQLCYQSKKILCQDYRYWWQHQDFADSFPVIFVPVHQLNPPSMSHTSHHVHLQCRPEKYFSVQWTAIFKGNTVCCISPPPRGGGYLEKFLLGMCRWHLRTPTPL